MPRAKTPKLAVFTPAMAEAALGPPPAGGWRIIIPGYSPPTINALMRGHWAKRAATKKAANNRIALECRAAGIPRAEVKRRVAVAVFYSNASHKPDSDNISKCLRDGLVVGKALVDDSCEWCEGVEPKILPGPTRATVIDLEDC